MKLIKYAFSTVLLASLLTGCKKELELRPTDRISDDNAFLTMEHLQLGTNTAFARFGAMLNNVYATALVTDEAKLGLDNAGQGALTYRYQYNADNTSGGDVIGSYYSHYFMIDQANRVLANVAKVIPLNDPRKPIIRGQLLALRAIGHFAIMQAYCKHYNATDPKGIAYMLNYDATAQPARLSMGAAMNLIEQDLADAYALLPAVTPATFTDTVMNRLNIDAFRARIALYKGDYQKAIDYANVVIGSGIKPLVTGNAFNGIWTDLNQNEILFRTIYSTSAAVGSLWTTTSSLVYIAPSDKLIASYGTGDIRKAAFIGTPSNGNNYVNKFYTSVRGPRVVDLKAIRMAEIYLIRAEAYARLGTPNLTAGAADLNMLRSMRITGYTPQTFATAADLLNAVLAERYKELCFEGSRLFDLKRYNLPVQRLASDVTAPLWQTLPAGDYRFVLPIPFDEILANPNMVQNDGY